jgi:hypothetical protein
MTIFKEKNPLITIVQHIIDTPQLKGVRILELITALSGFPYLGSAEKVIEKHRSLNQ